jgi:hypothetical protein
MPLDALGCTRATMVGKTGFSPLRAQKILQPPPQLGQRQVMCPSNMEFLVVTVHQTVAILSLLFVHTARRSYRLGYWMK